MRTAIYPGTFDPITFGHADVIQRASEIFEKVIVAVAQNPVKEPMFTDEERMLMVRTVVKPFRNVEVDRFQGLLVAYARRKRATAIVRGLRAISDFEYEFQMALTNRKLAADITTVFLMPHEKYTYLNSSIVREVARLGGDVSEFVPRSVRKELLRKLKELT